MRKVLVTIALVLLTVGAPADSSAADKKFETRGTLGGGGARVDVVSRAQIRAFAEESARMVGKPGPRWAYRSEMACRIGDLECASAQNACRNDGGGFQFRVYRRQVDENNEPIGGVDTPWDNLGTTCFADELPGENVLPIAEVLTAFRRVQFTKPELSIQPVGNLTLVNLPTYFETKYPQPGLGPGEIDESSLLGNRVQIRVLAQSLN